MTSIARVGSLGSERAPKIWATQKTVSDRVARRFQNNRNQKERRDGLIRQLKTACCAGDADAAQKLMQTTNFSLDSSEWTLQIKEIFNSTLGVDHKRRLLHILASCDGAENDRIDDDAREKMANHVETCIRMGSEHLKRSGELEFYHPDDDTEMDGESEVDHDQVAVDRGFPEEDVTDAIDEESRQQWYEWVVQELQERAPDLMTWQVLKGANRSVLEAAIAYNADWAIPDYGVQMHADESLVRGFKPILEDGALLTKAAEHGHPNLMQKLVSMNKSCKIELGEGHSGQLLDTIITAMNYDLLKMLHSVYPDLLKHRFKGKSALQLLRELNESSDIAQKMDAFLVSQIVRRFELSHSRMLLGTERELCLDLTEFDAVPSGFASFIRNIHHLPIKLESTLLYVHFPELNQRIGSDASSTAVANRIKTGRTEVNITLDWLRANHVESILDLRVPDSMSDPHREEDIERSLKQFASIEKLDWRKMDLSMTSIQQAKSLRELWLYSSGNWNSLAYWISHEGILSLLPDIKRVHILFVKDMISDDRISILKDKVSKRILDLSIPLDLIEIDELPWPSKRSDDMVPSAKLLETRLPVRLLNMESFLSVYRLIAKRNKPDIHDNPVKVAIIDTGIDLSDSNLSGCVERGASFVHNDANRKESPWYLPSDVHGTQMAKIIQDICPDVRLYIAKVGTERGSPIRSEHVAEAMKWAVEKGVDIINMSMIVKDEENNLETLSKIVKDAHQSVVFITSTEDQGSYTDSKCFPNPDTDKPALTIAASNRFGIPLPSVDKRAEYYFQGERMAIRSPPAHLEEATGSSVATAVATGTAALSLALFRRTQPQDMPIRGGTSAFIRWVFRQMQVPKDNEKFTKPERFFTPSPRTPPGQKWSHPTLVNWAATEFSRY